MYNH